MGQQFNIELSEAEVAAGRRRLTREGLFGYVYNSETLLPVAEMAQRRAFEQRQVEHFRVGALT